MSQGFDRERFEKVCVELGVIHEQNCDASRGLDCNCDKLIFPVPLPPPGVTLAPKELDDE